MVARAARNGKLAVIPAKGRSTRFPGKNKALLAGKPLVVRAVEVAQECALFETVMVSTDDDTIARLASHAGAEVPFQRDASLAEDTVEVPAVVRHAVEWYEHNRGKLFEWVCVLQPTSPLRAADDLIASAGLLDGSPEVDAVVSVSRYHHHPQWALRIAEGRLLPDSPTTATSSRQDLPPLYHPDGTVLWWRVRALRRSLNVYDGLVVPYRPPRGSALDVDYPDDLALAEWRFGAGAEGER
jgi:CMP-N-acetylneuraminic acid synthetase